MPSLCNGMKRFVKSKERQQKIQVACQAGPPSKASHVTPQDHPHVATGNDSIGDDSTVSTKEKHDDLLFLDLQGKDPRRRPSLPTRGAAASTLAALTGSDVTMGTTIHRDKATRMNLASSSLLHIDPLNGGLGLFVGVNPVSGAPAIDLQRNLLQQGTATGVDATKMVLTGLEAEYQQQRTNQIFGRSSSSPETSTRTIAHTPGALLAGDEQWGWSTTAKQGQYQPPAPTLVLAHRRHSNAAANDFGVAPGATIVNKPSDEEDHYDRLLSELLGVLTQKQDTIQEEINVLHALQQQQPRKPHAASLLSPAHYPPTSNGMTAKLSTSAWPYQKLNHAVFNEVLAATTPTAAPGDISAVASIILQKQREIAAEKVRLLLAQGVPNSTRSNME